MSVIQRKSIILGDAGVGKTTILQYYRHGNYNPNTKSTVGVEFMDFRKTFDDGRVLMLHQYDTASQERYHSLVSIYLRNAVAVIFVADMTDRNSLENIDRIWLPLVEEYERDHFSDDITRIIGTEGFLPTNAPSKMFKFFAINKCDLVDKYDQKFIDNCKKYAITKGMKFFRTSAVVGMGITELFDSIFATVDPGDVTIEAQSNRIILGPSKIGKSDIKEKNETCFNSIC